MTDRNMSVDEIRRDIQTLLDGMPDRATDSALRERNAALEARVRELAAGSGAILLCGRYEGVDHRVIEARGFLALSRDRGTARQTHDYGYGLVCGIDGKPLADGPP